LVADRFQDLSRCPLRIGSRSGQRYTKRDVHPGIRLETNPFHTFDEAAGLIRARLMEDGKAKGRQRSALDTIVAAVAVANGCVGVTDNEKDFDGVEIVVPEEYNVLINPLQGYEPKKSGNFCMIRA
jgi:predicted nucleic acid-binding protein